MGDRPDTSDRGRRALAAHRAETRAPRPTGGIALAGLCGAVVVLLGDVVVSAFYGWRVAEHLLLAVGLTVAGLVIGMMGYGRLILRNRKACAVELDRIVRYERGD